MTNTNRPRRSVLYMPGSKSRALEKAQTLPADALILDLEDAVAPAEKSAARDLVVDAVAKKPFGAREVVIRINGLDTEWGSDDLQAAATAGPDAILVPKVETAEQVRDAVARMDAAHAPGNTTVWAMMETPLGMLNAAEIAASSPRLACLIMGTNDLVNDLGARHTETRLPVITGLGLCMLAARALGLAIIDGVYNAFKDENGLQKACVQSREMGFDGRTLIHPAQIETANAVFAPAPEDIALAQRYVDAYGEAVAAGQGVAVVDGKIVENLHVATAQKTLALAEAIAKLETDHNGGDRI